MIIPFLENSYFLSYPHMVIQCDPNLEVHVVWINTPDPLLPHICLFAKRDIAKDEELTFDYNCGKLVFLLFFPP